MRFPEFLKEHGTIGFVAPSFGCATEPYYTAFAHARERFGQMGYHTQMGPNCLVDKGIGISNDPALCGKELNESYCGTENDVIISCGGGELMCEVVPYIDFAGIAQAKPKWYMGFSDNTNFTFLSATIADPAAVYGNGGEEKSLCEKDQRGAGTGIYIYEGMLRGRTGNGAFCYRIDPEHPCGGLYPGVWL